MGRSLIWLIPTLDLLLHVVKVAAQQMPTNLPPLAPFTLPQNRTKQATSVIISLRPEQTPLMICWYPISGNYCALPRVLFYATILAALVFRHYPWLRVGALATSLTYSGTAAIHACLFVWSRKAVGDLDIIPLASILSVAFLLTVPLLTWSSTIRHNIATAQRTIFLMWACLVMVGFICTFVAIVDATPDMRYGHYDKIAFSQATEIRCMPDNGTLDLSATHTSYPWGQFFITSDFLNVNNCIDPCPISPTVSDLPWFRDYSDLQSINEFTFINTISRQQDGGTLSKEISIITKFAFGYAWICMYVLVQGIWAVCLGRSQPSEARIRIYGFITRCFTKENKEPGTWITIISKTVAFTTYLGAVIIAVIFVPLLILMVTLIELYIQQLPQSETAIHVGAWSPYAVIGLALLSFFIAIVMKTTHDEEGFWAWLSNALHRVANFFTHKHLLTLISEQMLVIMDSLESEWKHSRNFWNNPNRELMNYHE